MSIHPNGSRNGLGALQRLSLFAGLNDDQRESLYKGSCLRELRRRRRLYISGDPSEHLYGVKSGVIKLSVTNSEGREIILSFLNPGEVFGELAVVDEAPRDHTAEAYEDAVVYAVNRQTFLTAMGESPSLAGEVLKLLGERQRSYRARIEELLYKSAHARVARTLLDLAGHHGVRDAQGVVIPLRLSQRDIANLVGLTRETVNFILKDLRQRNLIETQGRSIRVRAPDMLSAVR